ncbi:hypothetical protein QR680_010360 [Steinernema hermaphroditum]|uniref:Uncharacterized protein n=1 Tax=Steinernema hermaphroditum TaxID=289476 RepID=A0AA39IQ53_9BILA|nr:hypothetical protein QR680_010360 [Steinernema hermaphroditum]
MNRSMTSALWRRPSGGDPATFMGFVKQPDETLAEETFTLVAGHYSKMKLIKLNGINEKDAQVPKTKKRFWIQGIISCFNPRSRERADLNRSDRCQDCVDAPYLQTRNKDYHKAVLKLANDADVSPNDYKLYQLKSDDMSNLTMQSTFMWTLLKCMEGNAQRFGGGLAGVLHPSLWTDWPNTISQRNSMVEGLVRNYLVAPGPEMNWLLFPIQFDNRWILLICNSLLQKIHILDPMESNATVPVDTAKISLIFDIVTNQKLKVFELKAVNAPSNEQSSLYIMRYAEVFLNAPTWTGQCGVEHKFDEANFRNKVLWFLKPFKQSELDATRTMNKVVYLDRFPVGKVHWSSSGASTKITFDPAARPSEVAGEPRAVRDEAAVRAASSSALSLRTSDNAFGQEIPKKKLGPKCLDAKGRDVDYWVIYKHPQSYKGNIYTTHDRTWKSLNDVQKGAINITLEQDQSASSSYAHVKGYMGWNATKRTGFHVLHTHPRFPDFKEKEFFASASNAMGQMYFCTTHSMLNLRKLCQMVLNTKPYVYHGETSWCDFPSDVIATARSQTTAERRQPQAYKISTLDGKELTVQYHDQPDMIRNKKGDLERDLYDHILHYLNGDEEKFFLAHSWTSSPAATRQPTFCIPKLGCVLLILKHNLGGYGVESNRNTYHAKFAAQDSQAKRGALSIGLADIDLNTIFRCSMVHVDFVSNGHLIEQMKVYFNNKRIHIFNSICAGCPPEFPCWQSFGQPGYTIEQMIEDTVEARSAYYNPIKKSKYYPTDGSTSASTSSAE